MSLAEGAELESRYRPFFENDAIQDAVKARTPNEADPVDENAILAYVRATDEAHAEYVRSVFSRLGDLRPND